MPISRIFYRDKKSETNIKRLFEIEIDGIKVMTPVFHKLVHDFYSGKDVEKEATRIKEIEDKIDNIREKIDQEVYESRLFPLSFADRVRLGNNVDKIANIIDDLAKKIEFECVKPIKSFKSQILEMVDTIKACLDKTVECAKHFYDFNTPISVVRKDIDEIRRLENQVDEKELSLLKKLSKSRKDILNIILFREFIRMLSNIADRCSNLGETIFILSERRR